MTVEFALRTETEEQLVQQVSPRLVAANAILELSSQELEQTIAEEEAENPAIERVEVPNCDTCGRALEHGVCVGCLGRHVRDELQAWLRAPERSEAGPDPDDDLDPLERLDAEATLAEELLVELMAVLPPSERELAELLVGSLDERGYLAVSPEEVAALAEVELERVEHGLQHLRQLEPIGWGARSLRECLLLQVDHLAAQGQEPPLVRQIVASYLRELSERKLERIARALGTTREQVVQAATFIRYHLHPFPSQGRAAPNQRARDARALHVRPDVIIRRLDNSFEVDVVESDRSFLRVNPLYLKLRSELATGDAQLPSDERDHIAYYVKRARDFIMNVSARRETLRKVTCCVVELQPDFLRYGVRYLKPLTRAQVAERLGLHESTISRATNRKYVLLPDGQVVPFSCFFTPSLGPKHVLEEIIASERDPLTDEQIKAQLEQRGISIARRTVTKYRTQMGILPATLRSPGRASTHHRRNGVVSSQ